MQKSINLERQYSYSHNNQFYRINLSVSEDSIDLRLDDPKTEQSWKNSFASKYIVEISEKAGKALTYTQFVQFLSTALEKKTETLFVDVMSSFDLESIKLKRGGQPSQQNMKANKRYLIMSVTGGEGRTHYPLPLNFMDVQSNDKLKAMINTMKDELEQLRGKNVLDKSSSMMSDSGTQAETMRQQNQQLKQLIKQAEEQVSQKKGAVQMDQIVRDKNQLQMKLDAIRREQNKEILKLKSVFSVKERELNDIRNQINLITRELQNGQESNTKLKSHLMRVTKVHENQINNSKKLVSKQVKQIENLNRNIQTCKNNEKKFLMKIKQLQQQIDQAKKKANVKEISNRLHSPSSSKKSNYSAPNRANQVAVNLNRINSTKTDDGSLSAASKDSKPRSYNGSVRQNIVKPVITKNQRYKSPQADPLARTTPALTSSTNKNRLIPSSTLVRPLTRNTPPVPRRETAENNKQSTSIEKRQNNYTGSKPRIPVSGPISGSRQPLNPANKRSFSKEKPNGIGGTMQPSSRVPVYNARPKVEASEKEKNIFNKIEQIKNKFSKNATNPQQKLTNPSRRK